MLVFKNELIISEINKAIKWATINNDAWYNYPNPLNKKDWDYVFTHSEDLSGVETYYNSFKLKIKL